MKCPKKQLGKQLALAWTASLLVWAGGMAQADNTAPRPLLIVPPARQTPKLTADPSDRAWDAAAAVPSLAVSLGDGGKGLSPLPTQVKLLWDQNYLYMRFVCAAPGVYVPVRGHDAALYEGDVVEVFLDAKGDGRQWIELEVSPENATFDQMAILTAAPVSTPDLTLPGSVLDRDWWTDLSWSLEGWRTAATVQKSGGRVTGWTVDMALPAKPVLHRLGRDRYAPMTLRANFLRYAYVSSADPKNPRRLLAMNWSPVTYGCPHISPLAMGLLTLTK